MKVADGKTEVNEIENTKLIDKWRKGEFVQVNLQRKRRKVAFGFFSEDSI